MLVLNANPTGDDLLIGYGIASAPASDSVLSPMPGSNDDKRLRGGTDVIAEQMGAFSKGREELSILGPAFHPRAELGAVEKHLHALVDRRHRLPRGERILLDEEIVEPLDVFLRLRLENELHFASPFRAASPAKRRSLLRTLSNGTLAPVSR